MNIQDQIAQDQVIVETAQTALNVANAQLAADQAKLATIQPHLDLLTRIEAELSSIEDGLEDGIKSAINDVKSRITPLIEQIRSLFG